MAKTMALYDLQKAMKVSDIVANSETSQGHPTGSV